MTVFKFVQDKDVFMKFYSRGLARRLVGQNSASDDAESSMISKLKDACGVEYTSKLQRMFGDIGISKEINREFKEKMLQTRDEKDLHGKHKCYIFGMCWLRLVDFEVMVLTQGQWPITTTISSLILPNEVRFT